MKFLIKFLIGNPIGLAIVALIIIAGGVLWFLEQKKELSDGEKLRAQDRASGDSIWNDRNG